MKSPVKIKTAQFMAVIAGSVMALTLAVLPIHALESADAASAQVLHLAQAKPEGKRPPREAMQACEGQSSGDACSFDLRDGTAVKGTCRTPDEKVPAACVPANAHPEG